MFYPYFPHKNVVLKSRFHCASCFVSKTETYNVEYRYHMIALQGWVENELSMTNIS